jgi:2'-hydroxyisoflavone reductase
MLVLGGTRFLGPAIVDVARASGWEVTLFNRGKSDPEMYADLEQLRGDRDPKVDAGISALRGRRFAAVVDTSGYFPRHVGASAQLLADDIDQYVFISSVSAYAEHDTPGADETAPLAVLEDPAVETMGDQFENYGGLKVLCEQQVQAALPERATIVRPGFIVGPHDPSDRFTYWPVRRARGGTMLAPGAPDDPIQIIDVRDLGAWIVALCEAKTYGVFNAVGHEQPLSMGQVLEACAAGVEDPAQLRWVDGEFIKSRAEAAAESGEGPPLMPPIWIPATGESAGFHRRSNERALAAGLEFRPLPETVDDTRAWFLALPPERQSELHAGLSPEAEAALLTAFDKRA